VRLEITLFAIKTVLSKNRNRS